MRKRRYIVGIDEAGRGPLAGPLSVGIVCVETDWREFRDFAHGVRDSKKLSQKARELWFQKIKQEQKNGNLKFCVSFISARVIDKRGISWAAREAICRGLFKIRIPALASEIRLDGLLSAPKSYVFQETIIRGDEKEPIISLASIVAKVSRDAYMTRNAKKFPKYGFERHKGYGTKAHYRALSKFGRTPLHRTSFIHSQSSH